MLGGVNMSIGLGINVFSVHQLLSENYYGTLEQLSEIGYKHLELIGFNMKNFSRYADTIPSQELKQRLQQFNLEAVATHEGTMPGADLTSHSWDEVMRYYEAINCRRIVLPSAWIKEREDTLRLAEQLNVVGKKLHDSGFQFYLHNHAHEFARIDNSTLFDLLLEHTDPQYLKIEFDMAWAIRAGLEPLTILQKLGSRCDLLHQKDISKSVGDNLNILQAAARNANGQPLEGFQLYQQYSLPTDYVDLGEGLFDFSIYDSIKKMNHVQYVFVENEGQSGDKMQNVRRDYHYLQQILT